MTFPARVRIPSAAPNTPSVRFDEFLKAKGLAPTTISCARAFRIFTKFLLGSAVGMLSDKFGGQRTMVILFFSGAASLMVLAFSQSLGLITFTVILSFLSDAGLGVVVASQVSDMVNTGNANSQYTLSAFTNWIDIGSALGSLVIFSLISKVSFNSIFVCASLVL